MINSPPANLQRQLERKLSGKLSGLTLLGPLGDTQHGTRVNRSWLAENPAGRFVVKERNPSQRELGIARYSEECCQQLASEAGLAPRLYHADAQLSVSEFVDARALLAEDLQKPGLRRALGSALAELQQLEAPVPRLDWLAHEARYWQQLHTDHPDYPLLKHYRPSIRRTLAAQCRPVLCHHDLGPGNVLLAGDKIVFIDWEYARRGNPLWDQACLRHFWGIESPVEGLGPWIAAVAYIRLLWNALTANEHGRHQDIRALQGLPLSRYPL